MVIKEGFVQYRTYHKFLPGIRYEDKYLRVYSDELVLTNDFQSQDGLIKVPLASLEGLLSYKRDRF